MLDRMDASRFGTGLRQTGGMQDNTYKGQDTDARKAR